MLPEDVGIAVTVGVADAGDLPAAAAVGQAAGAHERAVLHLPHDDLAGAGIVPQDVVIAIAVEVAGALHLPAGRRVGQAARPNERPLLDLPSHHLAGRAVVPQDVAVAVAVEVAGPLDLPAVCCDAAELAPARRDRTVGLPPQHVAERRHRAARVPNRGEHVGVKADTLAEG